MSVLSWKRHIDGAKVVAVADNNPTRLEEAPEGYARKHGAIFYSDGIEMMDKVEGRLQEILDSNLRRKLDQVKTMEGMTSISPVFLFKKSASDIVGAGLTEDEHFVRDVRNHHETFLEFLRAEDAQDPESPHILYRKWYMSYKPVDSGTVPRYTGSEVPLDISLREGFIRAVGLAAWAAIMFVLALVAFQRMDAR